MTMKMSRLVRLAQNPDDYDEQQSVLVQTHDNVDNQNCVIAQKEEQG